MPAFLTDRAVDILGRLVAFDTESSKSNLDLIGYVQSLCDEAGVPTELSPSPDGTKAAILITIGPMVDGGILLSGHTDCVPVAGQSWSSDPFTMQERNGRLYGRGTCDMKGFDAIALAAMPEFKRLGLEKPIHILLSYDEEVNCLGPVALIKRMGVDLPRPRTVIVGEPTLMQVADTHKSVCTYRTVVHGIQTHSAKPMRGADAIGTACDLVSHLGRVEDRFAADPEPQSRFDPPHSTVHVGMIEGGTARNIVAGQCSFLWEFRGLPDSDLRTAYHPFEAHAQGEALARLNRFVGGGRIETEIEVEIPGLRAEPGSVAETLALRLARANRTVAVAYATEGGRFQAAGIPTVVCGPGSIDQAHQADEYIELSQVEAGLDFMRRLAAEVG